MKTLTLSSSQINILKYLAILFMVIDHISTILLPEPIVILNFIGRISFPLFACILSYNYLHNTKNKCKYIQRLCAFGLISQPFYYFAFNRSIFELNIFITLSIGLLIIYFYEIFSQKNSNKLKQSLIFIIPILVLLPISQFINYTIFGLCLIISFYLFFKQANIINFLFLLVFLVLINLSTIENISYIFSLFSIVIIYIVSNTTIKVAILNKWFFFIFYPIHLVVLKLCSFI